MRRAQSAAPPASINADGMLTPASSVHDDHEHPHASSSRGAPDARKPFPPSPAAADEHAWAASPAYSAAMPPVYASALAPAGFWGPTPAPATAMPPSRKRARSPDAPRAAASPPPADGACMCAVCRLPPPRSVQAAAIPPAVAVPPASGARIAHGVIEFSTHP
ncbi:hypothetical protein GGF31_006461 [Allomyces arbusculus]|nr:hypothetical protein GGF31_006461 [Allomyces arbusculus]